MTRPAPKVVLVTGASSGIGAATATLLAAHGHTVVLGARRTDRLAALAEEITRAGGVVTFRTLDVVDPADVRSFVDEAVSRHGRVDVLVNNAGVMPLSPLEEAKIDEWDRMIDVNVRGVLHGIAAALPVMRRQGSGQFVSIASIGAYAVTPAAAVYCATKYAVRAISDGLRQEVGPGIRVSTISPGVTTSELADSISDPGARELMRTYRANALPADAVAEAIAYVIEQPAHVDVNELVVRPSPAPITG